MKANPFLRVKIKSLAQEARIIRTEESRANFRQDYLLQASLREHRIKIVRREARATLLAYQYLRGLPFASCEAKAPTTDNPIDWESVKRMLKKYGGCSTAQAFDQDAWMRGDVLSKAA